MTQSELAVEALHQSRRRSLRAGAAIAALILTLLWGVVLHVDRTTRAQDEIQNLRARLDDMQLLVAQTRAERDLLRYDLAVRNESFLLPLRNTTLSLADHTPLPAQSE